MSKRANTLSFAHAFPSRQALQLRHSDTTRERLAAFIYCGMLSLYGRRLTAVAYRCTSSTSVLNSSMSSKLRYTLAKRT